MNSEKILTVSIAAYNVEKYIEQTLDSLVTDEQTMNKMEIIIVNDGSTDDTARLAEEYVNKYPDTFKLINKVNGGYGSTVNTTITVAKGKYYKLLDGDDSFDTVNLAGFTDYLEQCNSDIVLTPHTEVYANEECNRFVDDNPLVSDQTTTIEESLVSNVVTMHDLCVKTAILRDNGLTINERCFYTDTEYVIKVIFYADTISRYKNNLYRYWLGDENQSVSINGLKKYCNDAIEVTKLCIDITDSFIEAKPGDLKKKNIYIDRVNRIISRAYTGILLRNDNSLAKEKLIEFDYWIKYNYPQIYQSTNEVKRIRMMRKTGFNFIGMYRKLIK